MLEFHVFWVNLLFWPTLPLEGFFILDLPNKHPCQHQWLESKKKNQRLDRQEVGVLRRCWKGGGGPRVQHSQGPQILRSHLITILTLKKVHLVLNFEFHCDRILILKNALCFYQFLPKLRLWASTIHCLTFEWMEQIFLSTWKVQKLYWNCETSAQVCKSASISTQ